MYQPTAIPADAPRGLRQWLATQLQKIATELAGPEVSRVRFTVLHEPPPRYRDGDVVAADGTDWNPGAGAGIYAQIGAAWVKL